MKKRILAILLSLMISFSFIPIYPVYAAATSTDAVISSMEVDSNISSWALNDLIVGDNYDIYPISWDSYDMTVPISEINIINLICAVRGKLVGTACVSKNPSVVYPTDEKMTVQEVLNAFYYLLTNMEFTKDDGFSGKSAVTNMKVAGIYTGKNGEPALTDICSIEAACVYATRIITYMYDKMDAASKGFLWETKSGENTVYMLGSIHLGSTDIYPLSNTILDAYNSADDLVVELNAFNSDGAKSFMALGMYADGTTLKEHVSADTYQKVITLAAKYGYTEDVIAQLKPWYIDTLFSSLSYTDSGNSDDASRAANLGIDVNFMINAYIYGKPMLEVEGYEYQAQVLDSFSDDLDEYLLNDTVDSLNELLNGATNMNTIYLDNMLELWHEGDSDGFLKYSSLDEDYAFTDTTEESEADKILFQEYKDKLLTQRDLGMADYIDQLLKTEGSNTYFVVVGSAHYISDYSVLDILKSKGYEITQLK